MMSPDLSPVRGFSGAINGRHTLAPVHRAHMTYALPPDELMTGVGVSPDACPTRAARREFLGIGIHQCTREAILHEAQSS
jgi:hypothetical protein